MSGGQREPVKVLSNPTAGECAEAVMGALSRRRAVLVLGSCTVSYRGRSATELAEGERVVFVKEDGSILVHRTWGYKPVNYMPAGGIVYAKSDSGSVVLWARRGSENIRIVFARVYLVLVLNFRDDSAFEQAGVEAQMRRAVILSPEILEKGLKVLTQELRVKSGFVDLVALDSRGRLVAVEFKAKPAKSVDVNQLVAYVSRLRALSKDRPVRGILAAPGISKSAKRLLVESGLEYRRLDKEACLRVLEEFKPTMSLLGFLEKRGG